MFRFLRVCLTFARRAFTNLRPGLVPHISRVTFPLGRFFQSRYLRRAFQTIAHHRHQEEHGNPLLRGPWLKAALGEVAYLTL